MQHTVTKVQRPLVRLKISNRQQHRLVVHIKLDRFVVRDVHNRLTHAGEAEGLLGMPDRPRFMKPIDERAVIESLTAFFNIAAHAQITVADRKERLGNTKIIRAVLGLDEFPFIDRETVAIERVGSADRIVGTAAGHDAASSARSATTTSAPESVSR